MGDPDSNSAENISHIAQPTELQGSTGAVYGLLVIILGKDNILKGTTVHIDVELAEMRHKLQ